MECSIFGSKGDQRDSHANRCEGKQMFAELTDEARIAMHWHEVMRNQCQEVCA